MARSGPGAGALPLEVGHPLLQALDLGALAVAVALELREQVGHRGGDQAQHRTADPRHQAARRPPPGRGGGVGQAQRGQGRVARRAAQPQQQLVGVGVAGGRPVGVGAQ